MAIFSKLVFMILATGLGYSGIANAQSAPNCKDLTSAQRATIHQECVTYRGAVFQRVDVPSLGEAWRDKKTSLIWGNMYMTWDGKGQSFMTQEDAYEKCLELNPRTERTAVRAALKAGNLPDHGFFLPRAEDFESGTSDGIYDILPMIKSGHFLWSTSTATLADGTTLGKMYNGQLQIYGANITTQYSDGKATLRCVAY